MSSVNNNNNDEEQLIFKDITPIELETKQVEELKDLISELEELKELMLEFKIITVSQSEQLGMATKNVNESTPTLEDCLLELSTSEKLSSKKRKTIIRLLAILGGTGLGATGFLVGPMVGLGTVVVGSGLGWISSETIVPMIEQKIIKS